jgi:glutamyl-tRNA synthetase
VVRFKAPQTGDTVINDLVQGTVTVKNSQVDDLVLLRSDGSPTYMLSVVVDDHDMGITHIIRGDDHLTNAFRQKQMYEALGWAVPEFAHIPLIHGPDGAKLSKRHGALGAEEYRNMGYLPEALLNYLLRLGWAHGDEEIISQADAISWFDIPAIGRSPSRMDFNKLNHLNGHYIRHHPDKDKLFALTEPFIEAELGRPLKAHERLWVIGGMVGLMERAKTLVELAAGALVYTDAEIELDEKAASHATDDARALVQKIADMLTSVAFEEPALDAAIRAFAVSVDMKLGAVSQALRVALTRRTVSPSLFALMAVLGRDESMKRLERFFKG